MASFICTHIALACCAALYTSAPRMSRCARTGRQPLAADDDDMARQCRHSEIEVVVVMGGDGPEREVALQPRPLSKARIL
jgi:predicted polyphosphate/ATP-dependent NAD kinase